MTTTTTAAAKVPTSIQGSADRLVAFLQTGATDGLFAPDVFADITLPHWRVQAVGADEVVAMKSHMHPPGGRTRVEKVLAGPGGYTLKVEERWDDGGQSWYCREAFLCDVDEQGRITEFSVYCTGDWDEAAVAEHAKAVTLIRP
jgi:hypothetical protein